MNTRTQPALKVDEEVVKEGVSPQGKQVLIVNQGKEVPMFPPNMTNKEVIEDFLILYWAFTTQQNRYVWPRVNALESTMPLSWKTLWGWTLLPLLSPWLGKIPNNLDEVYNIVHAISVTSMEKGVLDSYQFKEVGQMWYPQWKDNRPVKLGSIE